MTKGDWIELDDRGAAIDPPGPLKPGRYEVEIEEGVKETMKHTRREELRLRADGWYWPNGNRSSRTDGLKRCCRWIGDLP